MADTTSLTSFLDDVASAIKYKKGDNTAIPAANFDTEIRNLPSQGTYEEKSVTITQNGTQNVVPDSGYDALSRVSITTAVPEKQLQTKSSTITDNGTIELHPDTGYDGFDQVNLTINVSGGGGDVKLFQSRASMIADTSEDEGTLGLIYYNNSFPITENSVSSTINLAQNVTLSEAYTGSTVSSHIYDDDTSANISFRLSGTMARFSIRPEGGSSITVSYTSSDGLNYTTSSSSAGINIDLGTNMTFVSDYDPWVPQFSSFATSSGKVLEGIYEYKDEVDNDYFYAITNWTVSGTTASTTNEQLYLPKLNSMINVLKNKLSNHLCGMIVKVGNNYYFQDVDRNDHYLFYNVDNSKVYYGGYYDFVKVGTPKYKLYSLDLDNQTFELYGQFDFDLKLSTGSGTSGDEWTCLPYQNGQVIHIFSSQGIAYMDQVNNSGVVSTEYYDVSDANIGHVSLLTWHPIKSQINLSDKNQLLPGIIALGNNGIITGDNTVFEKIDIIDLISTNLSTDDYSKGIHIISNNTEIEGKSLNYKTTINDNYYKSNVIQFRKLFNFNTSDICCYNFARDYLVILRTSNSNIEVYDLTGTLVLTLTTDIDTSTAKYLRIDDIDAGKDGTICYMIRYSDSTVTTVGILDITNDTGTCITFTNPARSYNHSFDVGGHIYTLSGSYTSSNAGVYKDGVLVKSDTNIGTLSDVSIRFFVNKNYIYWFSSGGNVFAYDITNNNVIKNTISSYTEMDSFVLYNSRTSDAYLIWWKIPETGKFTYVVTKFNNGGITEVFSSKTITIPSQITISSYFANSYTFPYYYNIVGTKIYSNMNFVVGISLNVSNGDLELNYFGNNISSENLHCYIDTIKYLMIKDDKVYECKLRYDYEITNTNTDYSLVNDCKVSQFKPFDGGQWYSYLILHNSL